MCPLRRALHARRLADEQARPVDHRPWAAATGSVSSCSLSCRSSSSCSSSSSCWRSSRSRNAIAPMSQGPMRRRPSWSVRGQRHHSPHQLPGSSAAAGNARCLTAIVREGAEAGSPIRSLGSRVMVQPVGSPMRLLPRVVTGSVQSPPSPNRPLVCPVTIVFWSRSARRSPMRRPLPTCPPPLSATVLLTRRRVPPETMPLP